MESILGKTGELSRSYLARLIALTSQVMTSLPDSCKPSHALSRTGSLKHKSELVIEGCHALSSDFLSMTFLWPLPASHLCNLTIIASQLLRFFQRSQDSSYIFCDGLNEAPFTEMSTFNPQNLEFIALHVKGVLYRGE